MNELQKALKLLSEYESQEKCPGEGCTDQGCPSHYASDTPSRAEFEEFVLSMSTKICPSERFTVDRVSTRYESIGVELAYQVYVHFHHKK